MKINISEIIKTPKALSHADGLILYQYIIDNTEDSNYVITFEGIEWISTAFLNASIGKLILDRRFGVSNVDLESAKILIQKKIKNVVTNAKNHVSYDESIDDATSIC